MQFSKFDPFKRLRLVLGNYTVEKFKGLTILLVGVGGIGCQVLKNLSKHPVKKLIIVDFDTIELSNLNRQFYFRKEHLQQSKAQIAREQILKIVPDLNIQAICGSIYDRDCDNYNFYSQFDIVISALDNMKARQHLARNCTRYGKVLIDAGTSGFNGQSYSSIRFVTSCHNCYPSNQEQNFAVCSIRTKPQRSIHCAVYAKNLYQQFFGEGQDDFLNKEVKEIKHKCIYSSKILEDQDINSLGIELFDYLFCRQFKHQLINSNKIQPEINFLDWNQVSKLSGPLQTDSCSFIDRSDCVWSLFQYAEAFRNSFKNLVRRKNSKQQEQKLPQNFSKDDEDCSLFVCCITNLRIFNFKTSSQSTKMKYLTLQECRRMIGKLIPAIASTNSIAASLEIKQLKQLISGSLLPPKYLTISPFNDQKISFSWLSLPNPECQVCSPKTLYFQLACKINERTFEQFEQFALPNCFSYARDLFCQNFVLIKNINANKQSANRKKILNFKPDLIIQNSLTIKYLPTSKISDLTVQIMLINDQDLSLNQTKFEILNEKEIKRTIEVQQEMRIKKEEVRLGNIIRREEDEQQIEIG